MQSFFLVLAVAGGSLMVLQFVLGLLGVEYQDVDELHAGHGEHPSEGLNLFSVRALTTGAAFLGLTGWGMLSAGISLWLALPAALLAGLVATVLVAFLMRSMLAMESDGSIVLENAVGLSGTVYIPIPAAGGGVGKVTLALQERTVELEAVSREGAFATGDRVLIVGLLGSSAVEVVSAPTEGDLFDA
jgi:hypothetical protein